MQKTISITEIVRNFSDFINRVAYRGDSFLLMRGRLKVAELRPVPRGCTVKDLQQFLESAAWLNSDELGSFKKDLTEIRNSTKKEKLKDPWA